MTFFRLNTIAALVTILRRASVPLMFFSLTALASTVAGGQNFTVPPTGDPSYTITSNTLAGESSTAPVVVSTSKYASAWGQNTLGAPWIAPAADQASPAPSCCVGDVKYTTTFSLQGLDPTTAQVILNVMADDYVSVYLNGTQVFAPTGVMYISPTTVPIHSGFQAGTNTLEFDVHNFGGATGLSVAAATGTAAVQSTAPPKLSVTTSTITGAAVSATNASDTTFPIYAQNLGSGGNLPISLTVVSTSSCTITANPDFFVISSPGRLGVTNNAGPAYTVRFYGKDPSGTTVLPGVYRVDLRLASGSMTQDVCLNATVTSAVVPTFSLSKTGLYFSAPVNGAPADQTVPLSAGGGSVKWIAKVLTYPTNDNFLTITPTTDTASTSAGTVGSVITAHVAKEATAGTHYGIVIITPQAPSTLPPQVVTVVYNAYSGSAPPSISPAALVVTGSPGAAPGPQSFSLLPGAAGSQQYTLTALSSFITLSSASGTIGGTNPVSVSFTINAAKLTQGFNLGLIEVQVGTSTQFMPVLVIYLPAAAISALVSPLAEHPALVRAAVTQNCTPTQIAVIGASLSGGFAASTGWPNTYTAQVLDDCANPVSTASVVLSFSDSEADLPLTILDATQGTYTATWTPTQAGQVTITARAASGSFSASTTTAGTVAANLSPVISRHGTLNNLNPQLGSPVAPGTVASIYGFNLAGGTPAGGPGVSPLLTSFQGVTATIGGINAPLYYVSDGQLNVEIPFELQSGSTYPVTVVTQNGVSVPDSVTITDTAPGIAVYGDSTLIAQHFDYTLVNASSPAAPGEILLMYLVGMGATNPAVATDGVGPSAEPLARVPDVTVTVNGEFAVLAFAGLTPGAIGLYQIDFTIPSDIKTGSPAVVVQVNGVGANSTSVPVVGK